MTYRARFEQMIDELDADPRVVVARAYLGPAASDEAIRAAEREVGAPLAPEVAAFYREMNGLSLRWVFTEEATPADRARASSPFDSVDSTGTTPGLVNLMCIEEVFVPSDVYQGELWVEAIENDEVGIRIGKKRRRGRKAAAGIRPFDYYSDFRMAAFLLGRGEASPPVILGDAHGADWSMSGSGELTAYLEAVLALRGSVQARATFMISALSELLGWTFAAEELRANPPALDRVLEWSRLPVDEADEQWAAAVEPMLRASNDRRAKRALRELFG
jgi:hypothetical protein